MRYLAVRELPRRRFWVWGHRSAQWHAVTETSPKPIKTVCGLSYTSEAHRTWDQTPSSGRCPQCTRLVLATPGKGATFISDPAESPKSA